MFFNAVTKYKCVAEKSDSMLYKHAVVNTVCFIGCFIRYSDPFTFVTGNDSPSPPGGSRSKGLVAVILAVSYCVGPSHHVHVEISVFRLRC